MFMEFQTRPETTPTQAFEEGFDLVDASEAWGLDAVWLAEFHFSPQRSVLSSPVAVASAIASRTQRLRIGTAVYVLPLNHPLRIAEEIATIDRLSEGRLDLGVGRSGFTRIYRSYGISYDESRDRFDEAMAVLKLAFTGEPFSFDGQFYQINEARLWPPPVQSPPPMRMAATTPPTFETVGAQGLPIFVGLRGDGLDELRASLDKYRAAWQAAGHQGRGNVYLRIPLYAAPTAQAARDDAEETLVYYFERQSQMVAADAARRAQEAGNDASNDGERAKTAEALAALSYEDILASRVAVGSAPQLVDRLTELQTELGLDGIVYEPNAGGLMSRAQVKESLRILTHEVMPAFK